MEEERVDAAAHTKVSEKLEVASADTVLLHSGQGGGAKDSFVTLLFRLSTEATDASAGKTKRVIKGGVFCSICVVIEGVCGGHRGHRRYRGSICRKICGAYCSCSRDGYCNRRRLQCRH
jgi:hypothetical protein